MQTYVIILHTIKRRQVSKGKKLALSSRKYTGHHCDNRIPFWAIF